MGKNVGKEPELSGGWVEEEGAGSKNLGTSSATSVHQHPWSSVWWCAHTGGDSVFSGR